MNQKITLLLLMFFVSGFSKRNLALIYQGPGSCEEGCSEAAAEVAKKAGYKPVFVNPAVINDASTLENVYQVFGHAAVWVQPGGVSNEAYYTMTPRLRKELYQFIQNGGGYVGFCAGAFMATKYIGGTGDPGLGVFPGGTGLYRAYPENQNVVFSLEKLNWFGNNRIVYFEGGPYLYGIENNPAVEIVARYDSDYVAAARTHSGKGRVFITGAHPEAPAIWTEEDNIHDPDGVDHDLAAEMVRWASGR